jgi:hypothetical protein
MKALPSPPTPSSPAHSQPQQLAAIMQATQKIPQKFKNFILKITFLLKILLYFCNEISSVSLHWAC